MADKEFAGSMLKAQWIYSGGTVQLETESRNFSYNAGIETIDRTAGADQTRKSLNSFKTASAALSMTAQSDGTALITALAVGTSGTLIFGEAGTVVGSPKTTLPARVSEFKRAMPYADLVTYDISWAADGDPVYGAY